MLPWVRFPEPWPSPWWLEVASQASAARIEGRRYHGQVACEPEQVWEKGGVTYVMTVSKLLRSFNTTPANRSWPSIQPGNNKGESITVSLTSCLTGLDSAVRQQTIFCFYLQNRLIQTNRTGGQWYSDTSAFSILWFNSWCGGTDTGGTSNFTQSQRHFLQQLIPDTKTEQEVWGAARDGFFWKIKIPGPPLSPRKLK